MTADCSILGLLLAESSNCQSPLSALPLQRSLERQAEQGAGAAGTGSQRHSERLSQLPKRHLDGSRDPSRAWSGSVRSASSRF